MRSISGVFRWPLSLNTTQRGRHQRAKAGELLLRLPWCGAISTSHCWGSSANRSSSPGDSEIAGQENPVAAVRQGQHDAVGVFLPQAQGELARRVQHFQQAALAAAEAVAGLNLADGDVVLVDCPPQLFHGRIHLVEHDRRDVDRADGKPVQQPRQGVVVVEIRMRQHHRVDVPQPERPERLGYGPHRGPRAVALARVVEHRLAGGKLDQHGQAVADA